MKKLMSLMMLVCACLLSQPMQAQKKEVTPDAVSYTHLTLPTNSRV